MFRLVSGVLTNGGIPEQVTEAVPQRNKKSIFKIFEGELTAEQAYQAIMENDGGGAIPRAKRYFCDDGEVFHIEGKTYVLSNQWGGDVPARAARTLAEMFPDLNIEIRPSAEPSPNV